MLLRGVRYSNIFLKPAPLHTHYDSKLIFIGREKNGDNSLHVLSATENPALAEYTRGRLLSRRHRQALTAYAFASTKLQTLGRHVRFSLSLLLPDYSSKWWIVDEFEQRMCVRARAIVLSVKQTESSLLKILPPSLLHISIQSWRLQQSIGLEFTRP